MNSTSTPTSMQQQFEALLGANLRVAYNVARRLTGNAEDAEDLIQEASLQAYRSFKTFEQGTHFRAWFLKIITNLFINRYRKKQREPELTDLDDLSEPTLYSRARRSGASCKGADPAAQVIGKLEADQIEATINALPVEFRLVSILYFVDEMSYQEISDIVGCPIGTVRSRLHRARKALQNRLWELVEPQMQSGLKNARGGK